MSIELGGNEPQKITMRQEGDNFATQGPCPDGFHVPSLSETTLLYNTFTGIGLSESNFTNYLKIPLAGYMNSSATVTDQGVSARIVTCTTRNNGDTRCMYLYAIGNYVGPNYNLYKYFAFSIRPFKDKPVTLSLEDIIYYDPDTQYPIIPGYETLYWNNQFLDGVFRDETNGIITIGKDTGDPTATWITISDKNLGATTVFNTGDTLSESNSGKYYQRGNNYGFPGIGSSETITTSSTKVDTTGYGPGNYYTSSTYITTGQDWSNPSNNNLWGGVTGNVPMLEEKELKKIVIFPDGVIEKQIRPATPTIEEYIMLSEGGATNRFNELSVDGSYQTVFNNTTNWYTSVTQTDRMNQSHKIFSDKEIVGFDLIFQYINPNSYSSVHFSLTTADKSKGFGSTDGQDSYSGRYGVRFEGDGPTTYVSGSVTTADVQIAGEKKGNTWTVNGSGGATFSQTFTVDYTIQRVACGAWRWFTGTTGYIKKLVLYLKDL